MQGTIRSPRVNLVMDAAFHRGNGLGPHRKGMKKGEGQKHSPSIILSVAAVICRAQEVVALEY